MTALLAPMDFQAQISHGGEPTNWTQEFELNLNWRTFAPLNLAQLESEDEVTATMKDAPWRFGIEHQVDWTMENAGVWTEENGMKVWRLAVRAEGTLSWSFYLSRFVVPKGGELFVWNEDRTDYLGSFNHLNVKEWEGLALSLIEGAGAVIEYREPLGLDIGGEIAVGQVVQGYRSLLRREAELTAENASYGPFGNSGACNINVNCPEGDDWQVENQSVALIVSGGFAACSGAMVNNTANDGTPYFLTANHCLGSPNSWTYYFNHESATCSGSTGPTNNSISGGTLLVADGGSDVALIELSSTPPVAWGVEYAGWDASSANHSSAVGIHHPSGDVKKICFENDAPYQYSTGGAQVWWISAWELGVTEPGSSGSPLFNQDHRIIGQLYGGAAACSGTVNNGSYDFYGRFDVSWGLGVSQYLDPSGSGTLVLDGYPTGFNPDNGCTDPTACNYSPQAINDDGSCTVNDDCGVCGGDNSSCGGCTNPQACNYDATAIVDDGSCVINGVNLTFSLLTDNYPGETTWSLTDDAGNVIMDGGPYNSNQTTYTESACVPTGCYVLTVNDSYGDGLQYGGVVGNYTMVDGDGNVLAEMADGGNFGSQVTENFCVEATGSDVPGCTDNTACNFDATATVDDGNCSYGLVYYLDSDGDGHGDVEMGTTCSSSAPAGMSFLTGDCNDANSTMYPGAPGTGAGVDNNCNGVIDPAEEAPTTCPEDVNDDGTVSVADVLAVLSEFGCTATCTFDVNADGNVNVTDVLQLLSAFGADC
ncbi:MAG: MopE-related protein [Bacteroidota bacterium]|nr:MopE-related protein [Bacteroidota bacterium]